MGALPISRNLCYETDGQKRELIMTIGPILQNEGGAWICECNIPIVMALPRRVYGEDALHALRNALEMCRASIEVFCDSTHRIWWLEPGDNAGL
jgi:hypothetical protein